MANQCSLLVTVSEDKQKLYMNIWVGHPTHYPLVASALHGQDTAHSFPLHCSQYNNNIASFLFNYTSQLQ
jgi:hypothetical protein